MERSMKDTGVICVFVLYHEITAVLFFNPLPNLRFWFSHEIALLRFIYFFFLCFFERDLFLRARGWVMGGFWVCLLILQ